MTPPPTSGKLDIGEMLLALGAIVFGILIVWQTTLIRLTPAYSKVGPRSHSVHRRRGIGDRRRLAGVRGLTGRAATGSAERRTPTPRRRPTGGISLLALALLAYLLLIERAGFIIASATLFVTAAFAMGSRRLVRDIAIGVMLATVLYLVFTRGLGLSLPAGILEGIV